MMRLFSLSQKSPKTNEGEAGSTQQHQMLAATKIRIQKDINELDLPTTCATDFPDPDDLFNFKIIICPDEGFYRGGRFTFEFQVKPEYPQQAPQVKCLTKIYHPNIDLDGNVCLKILREDWTQEMTINSIVLGLNQLLMEPSAVEPLNKDAADDLQKSRNHFGQNVLKAMRGKTVGKIHYECCLQKK